MLRKVLAFCLREKQNKTELLVLKKLKGKGIEVPGGSQEENETLEEALRRELFEETGIASIKSLDFILTIPFYAAWRDEWQERNIFKVALDPSIKNQWLHVISEGKEDKGKEALIYWLDIEAAKVELLWGQGQFIDQFFNKC